MPRLQKMIHQVLKSKQDDYKPGVIQPLQPSNSLNKAKPTRADSIVSETTDTLKKSASSTFLSRIKLERTHSSSTLSTSTSAAPAKRFQTYRLANIDPKSDYKTLKPALNYKLIQQVRADGYCGWRAAWVAMLFNADPKQLNARLKELGISRTVADRAVEASIEAKKSLYSILTHSATPEQMANGSILDSPVQVRYPNEQAHSTLYTDAEYDLYKILKVLLPKLDIDIPPKRIEALIGRSFADSEEVLSFARLLNQELIVNAKQQVHTAADPSSRLGQALDAQSGEMLPMDQVNGDVTLLYVNGNHFNIQIPEPKGDDLMTVQKDQQAFAVQTLT